MQIIDNSLSGLKPNFKRAILIGVAVLASCSSAAPATYSVTSAAETVPVWDVLSEGYPCADECGCQCQAFTNNFCPRGLVLGGACSPAGMTCVVPDQQHLHFTEYYCDAPDEPPTLPPPTWQNVSNATEQCLDICGTDSCSCVRNRCTTSTVYDGPCSTIGASCNLLDGDVYYPLSCTR